MSSVTSNKKYKITLFQVGLSDSVSSFDKTKKLLCEASSNFIRYGFTIDMRHFNPSNNCFY